MDSNEDLRTILLAFKRKRSKAARLQISASIQRMKIEERGGEAVLLKAAWRSDTWVSSHIEEGEALGKEGGSLS